ncbi:carbohydrate-binding module family 18 protein [Dothistroma septosporum NZE10]|uniref:Carbohydrate-binding module family 18 protein n=1 Tax=Dothistroma septosporum (strain NZE10 / CBS 128990) TaxID=675120 RepID=N1PF60_DOTSN|nr:carbohydrate-binding module family 18 protein [Dothistroma septosporum NZE10]
MHAIAILSLAVLATAVPHRHSHQHLHAKKNLEVALAGRDNIDWNLGTCGGSTGFTCGTGFCCSKWGYCGTDSDYCGAGCQFGACNGEKGDKGEAAPANNTATTISLGKVFPVAYTLSPAMSSIAWPAEAPATTLTAKVSAVADKGHSSQTYGAAPPAYSSPVESPASSVATPAYTAPSSSSEAAPVAISSTTPPVYSATTTKSHSAPAPTSPSVPAYSSPSSSSSGGDAGLGNVYSMYTGNGEQSVGWPAESLWMSFDDAWKGNLDIMAKSCTQWGVDNNSDQENADLKSAIQSVAQSSGVDERFILAIVMQESNGCVRAPTTSYSVSNPGLMQSFEGTATCNPGSSTAPQGQTPCPSSSITNMIEQGTNGSKAGDMSLVYALQQAGCDDISKYYKAARIYNSGSIASGGDLGSGVATHCYASDVANRLTGWTTATCGCNLD